MISPKAKISVIIPAYNSWDTLKSCIESVSKQTLKAAEIIVVDNGSADGTSKKIKKYFPWVKLITLERNTGVTGGRNAGINKANKNSNYLFFFDHDMVAQNDLLENLLKTAEKKKDYGIITPKIYYFDDRSRIWAAGTNIDLWTGRIIFRGGKDKKQFEKEEEVQVAPAAFLVKREVINRIYGFDVRYFATYEDTDFCFRAKKAGFQTLYSPKAVAFHKLSPKVEDDQKRLLDRGFWVGRNRILFMGDYGKNFYLFLLVSPIYFIYFIQLSMMQKNFKGLINYLSGVVSGIIEELISRRIIIHLPFSIYNGLFKAIGDGSKKVLDVACGDGKLMSILDYKREWKVTGIDIYQPYVERAKQRGVYEEVVLGNIINVGKIFRGKKFDVVLISSVLDHMEKEDAMKLIEEAEKIGKKVILGGLPNGFLEKHEAYFWEGDNPHQEHKSHWDFEDFENRGYKVRGFGSSFMIGEKRISSSKFLSKSSYLSPLRLLLGFIENFGAYILSPFTYYFPKTSVCLMAIKETLKK